MDIPEKFARFLEKLENVTEHKKGLCWSASCPAHPHDNKPSLSINIGRTGNLVVTCHSANYGCTASAIVKSVGLSMGDLFLSDKPGFERGAVKTRPRPDVVYQYQYEDGSAAYETCRYNNPKDFAQRRPNPLWKPNSKEPRYLWNLEGVRLVVYRLPRLIAEFAKQPERWVALVEGEKCADSMEALGILSTTHPLGSDHWQPEYAEQLAGRRVAIFYDLDPYYPKKRKRPGQAWAVQAARDLVAAGCKVRICKPPGLADNSKGDVADFIVANLSRGADRLKRELFEVIQSTADYFPGWETMSGYQSLQHAHRDFLRKDAPADMRDAIELVQRRLSAALDGVKLDSLPSDLALVAAWCQWLAETVKPSLRAENIRLGEEPTQISEPTSPEGETGEAKQTAREENPAQALCVPANLPEAGRGEEGGEEPEIV